MLTYAPPGLARLVLKDVFKIQQSAQVVLAHNCVFPPEPSVHFRVVP